MILLIYLILLVAFIDTFAQMPIISPFAKELGASPFLIGLAVGIFFGNKYHRKYLRRCLER